MTDEHLSALLRVKRHEQPPEGYFDQLLRDVHRRQRAELLRQPLWKIALERWQTFFSEHSMGPYSYAGAMASVLVVGAAGVLMLTSAPSALGPVGNGGAVALQQAAPVPAAAAVAPKLEQSIATASLSGRLAQIPPVQFPTAAPIQRDAPRYVIDARPVSYGSFSF